MKLTRGNNWARNESGEHPSAVRRSLQVAVAQLVAVVIFLAASLDGDAQSAPVRVAFIGDQGLGSSSVAVLQLIKDEGTDIVLHQGDFDYGHNPDAWDAQITSVLGPDFPYLASAGNHDECCFAEYAAKVAARVERYPEIQCSVADTIITKSACTFRGISMVFAGPGTAGDGDNEYAPYISSQLAQAPTGWRICSWHKVMSAMNVGGKEDETGWGVYEECRKAGAIIATAHEHSYARTHLMSSFPDQVVASTSNELVLEPGKTFAFHSGLGGESIREQEKVGDWWGAVYTSNQEANYGALFCTFFDGSPDRASCYFKDIDGNVPDSFSMVASGLPQAAPTPGTSEAGPEPEPTASADAVADPTPGPARSAPCPPADDDEDTDDDDGDEDDDGDDDDEDGDDDDEDGDDDDEDDDGGDQDDDGDDGDGDDDGDLDDDDSDDDDEDDDDGADSSRSLLRSASLGGSHSYAVNAAACASNDSGLSRPAYAGIGVVAVGAALAVAGVGWYVKRRFLRSGWSA